MNTGSTLSVLKLSGTTPSEKEQLNKISRGFDISSLRSFRILVGMLKGPEALLTFRLEISSSISEEQVGKRKKLTVWGKGGR